MHLESYPFIKRSDGLYYEFYSEGPKGRIKKVVEYYRFQKFESELFNLAFGDQDEISQRINDLVISENSDREKVLATVAKTIISFIEQHPHASVLAVGSTLSRTRLYQMSIVKYLDRIVSFFEIQGYINRGWQHFQKGINYTAFLLRAK